MQFPRLFWWLMATIVLMTIIGMLYPQQIPVSLYKLSLITMAGVVGYWLDRSIFPYARPDAFIEHIDPVDNAAACDVDLDGDCKLIPFEIASGDGFVFAMAMLRRAVIVGCAMLAIGLGA